jgi:3-phytase
MPRALLPDDPATPAPADWYSPQELAVLPLSSKSHWDVPVKIGDRTVHLLISHPTPPAFDGPEDRNGRRNHDEVRFWRDYITRGANGYIRDDLGRRGGLGDEAFLIMGDLNSDPVDGGSLHDAISGLLSHPRIAATPTPQSAGAVEASSVQKGVNATQRGDARYDTADFNDASAGNLRADYLLPEKTLTVCGAGVFWPLKSAPEAALVWGSPPPSSDHRLVWLDISPGAARCRPGSDPTTSATSHPRH